MAIFDYWDNDDVIVVIVVNEGCIYHNLLEELNYEDNFPMMLSKMVALVVDESQVMAVGVDSVMIASASYMVMC
jgi:hypothetical protein